MATEIAHSSRAPKTNNNRNDKVASKESSAKVDSQNRNKISNETSASSIVII